MSEDDKHECEDEACGVDGLVNSQYHDLYEDLAKVIEESDLEPGVAIAALCDMLVDHVSVALQAPLTDSILQHYAECTVAWIVGKITQDSVELDVN